MSELNITPGPKLFHDYAQPPEDMLEQQSSTSSSQTELKMEDILLKAEQADQSDIDRETPAPSSSDPDIVKWATETDERVKFYTGIRSKNLLNGKLSTVTG